MSQAPLSKVGIIANPWSGRGVGERLAAGLAAFLTERGYVVNRRESAPTYFGAEIDSFFCDVDAVVVIGGDGTVGKLLPVAARTATPLYMLPAGNESLFARAFGMQAEFAAVEAALKKGDVTLRRYGMVGEQPFFLMASVGFDAMVIELLSRARRGPVGTRGYVVPTCKVLLSYKQPLLTVTIDGRKILERQPGYFIVANSREYARKMDPVPTASSENPLLTARFFPNFSRISIVHALCAAALKRELAGEAFIYKGSRFEIMTEDRSPVQVDGDFATQTPVVVERAPMPLPILMPSSR